MPILRLTHPAYDELCGLPSRTPASDWRFNTTMQGATTGPYPGKGKISRLLKDPVYKRGTGRRISGRMANWPCNAP
jgi:hypothetical protein